MRWYRNRFLLGYFFIYTAFLVVLNATGEFPLEEALAMLVFLGVAFPALSYFLTRSSQRVGEPRAFDRREYGALAAILIVATLYLSVGPSGLNAALGLDSLSPAGVFVATLIQKLLVFVVFPGYVLCRLLGFRTGDFGAWLTLRQWVEAKHFGALVGLSLALLVFQYFVGSAAAPVRSGELTTRQLMTGLPLAYLWLIIEVGLVEELFFRAILQDRLSVRLNSNVAGVVVASLIFGLAHAPGLYLRGAGGVTLIGESPSLLLSVGYSVIILSLAGIFLGVVWARTRNLLLVVLIHAAADLLPNLAEFVRTWRLS